MTATREYAASYRGHYVPRLYAAPPSLRSPSKTCTPARHLFSYHRTNRMNPKHFHTPVPLGFVVRSVIKLSTRGGDPSSVRDAPVRAAHAQDRQIEGRRCGWSEGVAVAIVDAVIDATVIDPEHRLRSGLVRVSQTIERRPESDVSRGRRLVCAPSQSRASSETAGCALTHLTVSVVAHESDAWSSKFPTIVECEK